MWKMTLLRNAIKSSSLIRFGHPNQGLPLLLRDSPRPFSTETEQPTQDQDPPADPFLQAPTTGLVYGRLSGITNHTTKSDILNLLEGCNLGLDDIKASYNRSYAPTGMMIQFPSRYAYDNAVRAIARKGRLFKLERAFRFDRTNWDLIAPFNGKAVLLQGIPRNALQDDVERFLSGCQYDASSIMMFARDAFPDPIRMALVRFTSQTRAMHAFITKNRGFCLNNQVLVRVLQ